MTLEFLVCPRDMRDDHPEQLVESCENYDCDGIQVFPDLSVYTDEYERRTVISECTECGETRNVSTKSRYLTLRLVVSV